MLLKTKTTIGLALAAIVAMTGTAWGQNVREITYALPSKSLVSSAPRIADALGLFAKHGLLPTFSYIDSTAQTAMSILSRSVEFGQTAPAEIIAAEAKGQHLVLIANHYSGLAGSLVLSKATVDKLGVSPDAPVAERLKALNNVLLASVSKISSLTIAYKGAANSVGAEPRFTYMALSAMGAAMEAGAVEGMIVTAPIWTYPVRKGTGVLWLSPAKGDIAPQFMPSSASVTAVSRQFAGANPEVVKKVAAVFDDLADEWAQRPDAVKAVVAKLYPDLDKVTIDQIFTLEARAFVTKPLTPADIRRDIKYMTDNGGDFGPIDKIDPAAILYKR